MRPVLIAALALMPSAVLAGPLTPPKGSHDRAAIMDAIRPMAETALNAPIEFVVETLNVQGDWAYAEVKPQRPGGGRIDLRSTPLGRTREFMRVSGQTDTVAILRRGPGGWRLVEGAIGPTDVMAAGYCDVAPRAILVSDKAPGSPFCR